MFSFLRINCSHLWKVAGILGFLILFIWGPVPAHSWTVDDTLYITVISDIDVSPDGRTAAYVVKQAVMTDDRSTWERQVYLSERGGQSIRISAGESAWFSPKWSPDGRWIAFLSHKSGDANIWIIPAEGGRPVQATDMDTEVLDFQWAPDSGSLSFRAPDPLPDHVKTAAKAGDDAQVKGQFLRTNHLWNVPWLPPSGSTTSNHDNPISPGVRVTSGDFSALDWDWSPDGQSLVFSHVPSTEPADSFFSDISTVAVKTGKINSLVQDPAMNKGPLYSPDGRWIAYTASDLPPCDFSALSVFLIPVEGGAARRLSETHDQKPHLLGWSKTGDFLYFWEYRGTGTAISALPADGGDPWDISGLSGVMDEIRLNSSRKAVGFTFQSSSVPPEVYLSALDVFDPEQLSRFNEDLPLQGLGRTEIVTWTSTDGLEIEGLLTYPADYRPGERYPLLLVIHGGPASTSSQAFIGGSTFYPMSYIYPYAAFSAHGYSLLRPNPRGSGGYGAAFRKGNIEDWGGMDHQDLMTGVDHLIDIGLADPDRLGIMGWSYGGYMTAWTITQTRRFKAASVGGGITNLISMSGTSSLWNLVSMYMKGNFWEKQDLYLERSPIFHAPNVITPVLIQHGAEDSIVPPTQAKEFYRALVEHGVPVEMVMYLRSGHVPEEPKLLRDAMRRNLEWFKKHVP